MAGKRVLYFISGILLFSISIPLCFADEFEELYRTKENICSLIDKGKFSEAKVATDKMTIEYVGQEKLPEMLYWAAGKYQQFDRFEDAKGIYQQIIQNYPESPWAGKAKLSISRVEAMSLIISGNYAAAKEAIDKMASDFAGSPDLPETLYWNAVWFNRASRFEDGKQLYQKIIDEFPESPYAGKARFGVARTHLTLLIISQDYQGASSALDKLVSDYAKHPDLPEALYWITERYERAGRAEDANRNYQRVIDLFPYSPFAKKAKLGIPRAEARGFVEAKDFTNADIALNKMASDFANHPDLPETLYWLAVRYQDIGRVEDANRIYQQITQNYANTIYASKIATAKKGLLATEGTEIKDVNLNPDLEKKAVEVYRVARGYEDSNQFALAGQTYEKVIKEYPGTIKAGNAVLDIGRLYILKKMETGEVNEAGILLDKFVADFKQHPYACESLAGFAKTCYMKAAVLNAQGNAVRAKPGFETAIKTWKLIIDEFPPSISFTPHAWFFCGVCYSQLGQTEEAKHCYRKVADDWPDYGLAKEARLMAEKGFKNVMKLDPNTN